MFRARLVVRIIKGFAVLAVFGVLGVGVLLGLLWLEHKTEITLPTPTGPFTVGRTTYAWLDDADTDELAPLPETKRLKGPSNSSREGTKIAWERVKRIFARQGDDDPEIPNITWLKAANNPWGTRV